MPANKREKLMKAATERKMRRRWSFFEQLFRPGGETPPAREPGVAKPDLKYQSS